MHKEAGALDSPEVSEAVGLYLPYCYDPKNYPVLNLFLKFKKKLFLIFVVVFVY